MYEEKALSRYAILFSEASRRWTRDAKINLEYIGIIEQVCNQRLKAERRLYLNDVYEMLDVPKTKAGECVGWIYNSKYGDGYVSINIEPITNCKANFVLDFNVDGQINYTI